MPEPLATRRPTPSAAVLDLTCFGLALWTVLCNALVLLGATPRHLHACALALGLALLAALVHGVRKRRIGAWLRAIDDEPAPTDTAATELAREPGLKSRALFFGLGAAATVATALRSDLGERWLIGFVFFAASYAFVARSGRAANQPPRRGASEWALWLLGLACAALTLSLHEPNSDDAFYGNLAVSVVDFPDRSLLAYDTLHGIAGAPIKVAAYGATSVELLVGSISRWLGIDTLVAYHMLVPALAALLVPLALARLLRVLDGERWIWAAFAVVILLALDAGGGRGSFQKFAFVRLFQGKAMFATLLMPVLLAYGVRFALRPSRMRFAQLAAAQIAALGATVTAFWAAPVLAMIGAAVALPLRPVRRGLATLGWTAASSAYLLGLGAYYKLTAPVEEVVAITPGSAEAVAAAAAPNRLLYAYEMVLGADRHLVASLAVVFLAWPLCRTPLARRFAVVVPFVFFAVQGNPWLVHWVSAVTTTTVHWRVLWFLPVPLIAGLAVSSVIRSEGALFGLRVAGYALLLTLFLQYGSERLAIVGKSFGWPRPKVGRGALDLARTLCAKLPPHSQAAAPPNISRVLPMLNGYSYPLVVKEKYLPEDKRDSNRRVRVTELLRKPKPTAENIRWIMSRLDRYRVEGLIAAYDARDDAWAEPLTAAGFQRIAVRHKHQVWWRRLPPAP